MRNTTTSLVLLALVSGMLAAASACADDPPVPPLKKIEAVVTKEIPPKGATWQNPLVLKSKEDAAEHFEPEELDKLNKQADFAKQVVLVFGWSGSGQDRLDALVAESMPEQISFILHRGRTRDLRHHVHIFALRSNVTWTVRLAGDR